MLMEKIETGTAPFHYPTGKGKQEMAGLKDAKVSDPFCKRGRAELTFASGHEDRTYLAHQYVEYPFHITRPHYLDNGWPEFATLCLQSVSGGLLQGDRTQLTIEMQPGAVAQVTTQASTKVHSMQQDHAVQTTDVSLAPDSYLELLTDAMILFPRSRLYTYLNVTLAPGAKGILRDSFLFHDPRGNHRPNFDFYAMEVAFRRSDGKLLALDRQRISEPQQHPDITGVLQRFPYQGALFILDADGHEDILGQVRQVASAFDACYVGASVLPHEIGVYARILAREADALRRITDALVRVLRPQLMGKQVSATWSK